MSWAAGCFARSIGVSGVACPKVCGGEGVTGGTDAGACGVARSATTVAGPSEIASPVERGFGSTASGIAFGGDNADATGKGRGAADGGEGGAGCAVISATAGAGSTELASPVARALGPAAASGIAAGGDAAVATGKG
jgi:hypothetical protein